MFSTTTMNQTERNSVLRNTYMLLAASLIPAIIGAMLGVNLKIGLSGFWGFILALTVGFGFIFAIHHYKHSKAGIAWLLAFTFFEGLLISGMLNRILLKSNGSMLIAMAFGGTVVVFLAMAFISTLIKKNISHWGNFLLVGLLVLIVMMVFNIFFQSTMMMLISSAAVLIGSLLIIYDIKEIVDGGETNYIIATLNLFLDSVIVFQHLLNLLGIFDAD